ncbi:alpha-2-macroglobulin family protein [Neolewinella aurantiaca]|nr:alpha-2-macroglobulin family protein [Neolewinella aurantiaca]
MRHLLIALVLLFTANLMSQNYQAEKDKIETAMKAGKPRTALEAAEEYYNLAIKNGDEDQAIKALAYRAEFTSQTEEEGQDAAIRLIHRELAASNDRPVVASVLNYLLGSSYYEYARQNSWRLRNNTAETTDTIPAAERPLEDWNLPQLVEAAEKHLFTSLELASTARTPLSSVPAIVTNDSARVDERPTLYDLLVRESLSMLGNPLLSVGDAEISNPEQYLGSAAAFAAMPINATEGTGTYRKLKIYQDLTNFHLGPPSTALMSVDIDRIEYVRQLGAATSDYLAALRRMQETYKDTPGGQIFLVKEAEVYASTYENDEATGEQPKANALSILDRITDKNPDVATPAEQLRRQIMAKSLSVNVQSVYGLKENILISLNYRNIDRIYHRLYPAPESGPEEEFDRWRFDEKALVKLVSKRPLEKADFRFAANDDYEQHSTETWLKAQKPGRYYLVSSSDANFDLEKGQLAVTSFQVSDLAVARYHDGEDYYCEVVDRTTGAAKAGIRVEMQRMNERNRSKWNTFKTVTTGTDGRFENPDIERSSVRFILTDRANNDKLVTNDSYFRTYRENNRRTYPLTPLFTDRNIYRPGQTVKIYGLTWQKNPDEMPEMLTGQTRELILRDPNYQELSKVTVTSDEYSRFSAEFKLPEGGLTGNFQIQTDGGGISFRMEEYKRPRFEVELDGPDYAVAEEETEVKGAAKLYAGPGLDGAKVNYRVFLEEVSYWWWGRSNDNDRELIADGETETNGQGEFTVKFTPEKQNQKGRKRFRFVVEADVADGTGETHDASTSISLRSDKPVIALQPSEEMVDKADSLTILAAGGDENLTVSLTITPVTKPGTSLKERKWGFPDRPILDQNDYQRRFPGFATGKTTELEEWPTSGAPVHQGELEVVKGEARLNLAAAGWPVGHYRVDWTYPDGTAGASSTFAVLDVAQAELPAGVANFTKVSNRNPKVGETFTMTLVSAVALPNVNGLWASRKGYDRVETSADKKAVFSYTATDADRGGIALTVGYVSQNKSHNFRERFNLGWDNKKLKIDYATFRDKLRPGEPERWTLTVKNADGTPVPAAALASMYDASLDQISPNSGWSFSPFPGFSGYLQQMDMLTDGVLGASGRSTFRWPDLKGTPQLPQLDLSPFGRYSYEANLRGDRAMMKRSAAPVAYSVEASPVVEEMSMDTAAPASAGGSVPPPPPPPAPKPEKEETDAPVKIRTKLQETAFWLPDLTSDDDGNLVISFDSPEALTSWKFRLFAHDKELATAVSEQTIVTQKELMVLPNVPRFVREGDEIGLTARVNNMTETAMNATVTLELFDPATDQLFSPEVLASLGAAAGAGKWTEEQTIAPNSGESVSFALTIPDGFSANGPIGYRVIAKSLSPGPSPGEVSFSDGEENVIPVLTDRTLITVSQPFYLKRKEKKTISLPVLGDNKSNSLQHVNYTFQATTNPAWLALKSLPYLMEYPYDCTEQLANRYFANQLAYATVSDKPILEQVFREWQKDTNGLKSELEQNQNLKNALLTETPWLRAAEDESKQRARIGELFDLKRLADEQTAALDKLANRQDQSGYFGWFPGGRGNRYMTQYVVETLARLRQLKVVTPNQQGRVTSISESAILWLDQELKDDYQELLRRMKDQKDWKKDYRPSSTIVHYLYARALGGGNVNTEKGVTEALTFYTEQASAQWLSYGLYEQALLAVTDVTNNGNEPRLAKKIIESLRERALHKDEFGMYWKYGRGYRWQNLPIETHCRILEAFQLAGGTTDELDEMRLWLLTNKRTNRWETTKSTAAAVFALLNTGTNWTEGPGKPLEVEWPGFASKKNLASRVRAAQETAEAATGAFSVDVAADDITSGLASVKVKNKDNRLVWGGVYWQYTELAEKVETASDGPLTLERELFRRIPTEDGIRLEPITANDPLSPGDRVTVKLTLRSDRELDFVHLKDRRAATFEPIEQLSGYQYKGGLGYYFAPGDLATNFFIDHLPKGTFTVEYDLFATYAGSFSNGLGRVQCMYAPEFGANTNGARIMVK